MKKMKRILVALLSCTMAFACVAGLSACDEPTSSSSPAASSSSEVTDSSSSDSSTEHVHTGGSATCTDPAICTDCNEAYGEALGHSWGELGGEVDATCTENGTKAHFDCENCDAVSLDGENATEESLVIEATGHTWTSVDAVKPTCQHAGNIAHYACACGAISLDGENETTENVILAQMDQHNCVEGEGNYFAEVPATCTTEGMKAYYVCAWDDCDAIVCDVNGDKVVYDSLDELVIAVTEETKKAHHANKDNLTYEEGLAPDCVTPGYTEYYVCNTCNEIVSGKEELPANGHAWEAVEKVHENPCYATGTAAHYACACGAVSLDGETVATAEELVVPVVGHIWAGVLPQAATCTIEGYAAHFVCTTCGVESLDRRTEVCIRRATLEGDALVEFHKANNTYVLGHNATCDKDGNIEHYICAECEGTFDKDGKVVENVVIPATNHNWMNAYDYVYEVVMGAYGRGYITLQEAYETIDAIFPHGRNTDGYYCEFGPYCPDCEATKPGIGHTGGEATCSDLAVCDRCLSEYGDYADRSDIENHDNWTMVKVGAAPTCVSKEEFAIVQCDDCGHYAKIVNGEKVYIGEAYTEEDRFGEIDEDVHDWKSVRPAAITPTCTEPATYQVVKCEDCNDYAMVVTSEETVEYVYIEEDFTIEDITAVPALNHMNGEESAIVPATCTTDAYCTICGASGAALGENADYLAHHVWADELTVVENPVCGKVTVNVAHYDCVNCDVVKLEDGTLSTEEDVNGIVREHDIAPATCTADAYCKYEDCGASGAELGENADYLAHHTWSAEEHPGKQEDCIKDGYLSYYTCVCDCCECKVIGVKVDGVITVKGDNTDADEDGIIDCVEIPAKGHAWGTIIAEKHENPCTETGTKAHYECADCDAVSLDGKTACEPADLVIAVKGHVWNLVALDQKNPCTEEGTKEHYLCEVCGEKSFDKENLIENEADLVAPVVGHVWGEEIAQKDPTCNTTGIEAHFECSVCGAWAQGDEKTIVTEEEITIPADETLHVCADPSRFCSDKVVCDECHEVFEINNENPADHKDVNNDGKCDYCDHKEEADAPVVDGEGATDGE